MANVPVAGEAFTFTLTLFSQSTGLPLDSPNLLLGDVTVSTDGGAVANITNLPTTNPAGSGIVEVNLTADEVGTGYFSVRFKSVASQYKQTFYHDVVSNESSSGGGGGASNAILSAEIVTQDFEGKIVQ